MLHRAVEFPYNIAPIVVDEIPCPIDQWRFIKKKIKFLLSALQLLNKEASITPELL
jgi:hypothetical protein